MTLPDSGSSANSTERESPAPAELDTVFVSPSQQQWSESALAGLAPDSELAALAHETLDGLSIAVLYDSAPADAMLGMPQSGVVNGWDNRLAIEDITDATKSNERILNALKSGNTSVQFPADAKTDFATVLNGIMLDVAPLSLRLVGDYTNVATHFKTYIDAQGMDTSALICSFNADPVGHWLIADSPASDMENCLDTLGPFAVHASQYFPHCKTVLVDATPHHNAGASATQELHAAIATATLYLESLINAGLPLQQASEQIVFQMACDADVLMGVIKLRSLAHLWQHVLAQFGDTATRLNPTEKSALSLVVETSRRNQACIEHWNNHLRNMAACTAAAMGNATSIIVHPHDRVGSWVASDDASLGERMARNLPIILDRESGLTHVNDPFAGSFAIETLSSQLVEKTWQSLSDMSASGGWLSSITTGEWQHGVAELHARRISRLNNEQHIMVGVNRYTATDNDASATLSDSTSKASSALTLNRVRDAETFETSMQSGSNTRTDR